MPAGDANLALAVKLARLVVGGRGQAAEIYGSGELPYESEEVGCQTGSCFAYSYKFGGVHIFLNILIEI